MVKLKSYMSDISASNKLIAKNTIYLYFRTILILAVSLYASRVVLNTLGIVDFGIYNAVGGIVSLFAIISGALSNSISRYLTYSIGLGLDRLNLVFCTSLHIQIFISIIIILICEVLGVWFLNYKMNIPVDRLYAANWVLQASLLTFVINLISVPYNACIIAHEHMKAYAYISIIDAILKLAIVFLLINSHFDKLILYSILLVIVALLVRLFYGIYCSKNFKESHYKLLYDRNLFKEMLSFAGWNFFVNAASVLNMQGVTILINIYFGVVLNTARGIASQVEAAVYQFVNSFTTAINPQITRSYADNEKQRFFFLICNGARYSYLLLLIFAVPIIIETEFILDVWLKIVPDEAIVFTRLSIVGIMITTLGNTGYTACMATGTIKRYSIFITSVGSMAFFLTWLLFFLGFSVYFAYYVYIMVYCCVQIVRLFIMKSLFDFPISLYIRKVLFKIFIPTILSFLFPALISYFFELSILRFVIVFLVSILCTSIVIFFAGLTSEERVLITSRFLKK